MVTQVKRILLLTLGSVVLLVGIALLVLPGPGLLLVFLGVALLGRAVPVVARFEEPVRLRAMKAAEDSVSSPWRVAGSVAVGCCLLGSGVVLGLVPDLPFAGWSTGSSLILSGLILFALLLWSRRRVRDARRAAR